LLLPELRFDGNPIRLRDPESESIRTLEDLAADSSAPLFNLAVLVPNATAAEATALRLAPLDTVLRVMTIASLVPADQEDKLGILDDLDLVLGATLAGIQDQSSEPGRLDRALETLVAQLASFAARSAAMNAMVAEAETWNERARGLPVDELRSREARLDEDIRGNLAEQLLRLERGLGAQAFDQADLPPELRERWVNAAGEELVEVVPKENLNDSDAARRFVADVRSVVPNATGLPVVYEEASATVTRAFSFALTWAFIGVTLMLLIVQRSLRDTLLVLAPVVFATIVTAGCSILLGLPLNFANIIALPLLIGVGVDSGIHIVHRMRSEPPRDGDPLRSSTSRAVFASALTTIASFGNLAFSSHYGMASMGQLLTLGMVISLIAALGVLPAIMRLRSES
jgi:hopanoid biosynthesis associated RND transporter like protein HpnN